MNQPEVQNMKPKRDVAMVRWPGRLIVLLALVVALTVTTNVLKACTTILVGMAATADGSVLMATSCDGGIMGRVYIMPARSYSKGSQVSMYYDFPAPATWREHFEQLQKGYTRVGQLPVERTYHCVLAAGYLADSVTGGINEHGLSIGIEYMGMKPELVNNKGVVSTCSNHWTTSLIANALLRAKTGREAIRLMGAMVENYGFTYYWAPSAGCAVPIVDKKEAWIMEIFGPGQDWTPDSGNLGAVWCAQRVPDGEVTCNANRSRIGEVDLNDTDRFMASPNIHLLAEELGLWKRGIPFVWREVYGTAGTRGNSLREWAALNRLAPSLGLQATGDPSRDRYPFSVKPDKKIGVRDLMSIMRDCYEETEFDVTRHEAFQSGGKRSLLARPYGAPELFSLLDVQPERCIGSEMSCYVYVSQIRDWLPAPVAGCMWFTLGPCPTSCFAPIYAGVTAITDSWSRPPNFSRLDRDQVQWKFQLVDDLTALKYQQAIKEVRGVLEPAESRFLALQPALENAAVRVFEKHGAERARRVVTQYTNACLDSVDDAYGELVDYLVFSQLYSYSNVAPPSRPTVRSAKVPVLPSN